MSMLAVMKTDMNGKFRNRDLQRKGPAIQK